MGNRYREKNKSERTILRIKEEREIKRERKEKRGMRKKERAREIKKAREVYNNCIFLCFLFTPVITFI